MRSIRIGEDVLASDGSRLGQVERIVVDEAAHRVTHVVVHDRAIPVGLLQDAGPDGLAARLDHQQLEKLLDASEPPFAAPGEHWDPPEGYALEGFLAFVDAINRVVGQGPYQPPVHIETGASEIHEITSGSPVWCGGDEVGHVDRLLWDGEGRVKELVVKHGFPTRLTRVPVQDVAEVVANNVHLNIDRAAFMREPEFDPLED
ncbi:MAG TPA: PRC-barrel domain-containing protein [Candidatus Dormibacteraeota bacterium]